ncbi:Hypothetical protein D9617_1g083740 [Elsinoe fawcettii]|nr:Hypothetical protein D9617_1g083740 [Elsinoe fawcettii]
MPAHSDHRVVELPRRGELSVQTKPIPACGPGSALLRILAASIRRNTRDAYFSSESGHPLPFPLTAGCSAIARVVECGSDASTLVPGQLVLFDPLILARDNPDCYFISGMMDGLNEGGQRLARGTWRNSTYAEYALVPLENCHNLREDLLLGAVDEGYFGYRISDLTHLFSMLVPFGGLADVELKAGETIIVSPATGR